MSWSMLSETDQDTLRTFAVATGGFRVNAPDATTLAAAIRALKNAPPVHKVSCPCCASTVVNLEGMRNPAMSPTGKLIGPLAWTCAACGFALMGLAVPIRPTQGDGFRFTTCYEVMQSTECWGR